MSAPHPRVTIGLPVRNGEPYLAAAIESLLAQTFGDFELVISDNASTDATEQVCRTYAARDRRIRYVRQASNVGANNNFNLLVAYATAPYFKWASADDLVAPDLLEQCLRVIEGDPTIVLVHSQTLFIDAEGNRLSRDDSGLSLMEDQPSERLRRLGQVLRFCNAQFGVMRTNVLRQTNLFGHFVGSDLCFLSELALRGKFFEVPRHLLFRRLHDEAASNLTPEELLEHYGLGSGTLVLYYWRHLYENAKAALRAPLGAAERLRVLGLLIRLMAWRRAQLSQELGFLFRHITGRPYPVLGSLARYSSPRMNQHR